MIRLLLLSSPLLEIAGFILVGRAVGILPTLGLVALSALLGLALIRRAGREALPRAQRELRAGRDPGPGAVGAALDLIAGLLLIVPGFLSDLAALVLLFPPLRARAWSLLKRRIAGVRFAGAPGVRVVELDRSEFRADDGPPQRGDPSSPWKRLP